MERVDARDVVLPMFQLLKDAVAYLAEEVQESARVKQLAERVAQIPRTPIEKRLPWLVGLARATIHKLDKARRDVLHAHEALWGASDVEGNRVFVAGSCHAALMFGSASPTLDDADVIALARTIIDNWNAKAQTESPLLRKLVTGVPIAPRTRAFESGYALAEALLADLDVDLDQAAFIDVRALLKRLRVTVGELNLRDMTTRAVSIAGEHQPPRILLNTASPFYQGEPGRRFTLAHELCHLLHDRAAGRALAVISGPWAPRDIERRANAFAAMLLMPTELVRRALGTLTAPADTFDGVSEIASTLKTSVDATIEHVGNLLQWDDVTRYRLRDSKVSS